MSEHITTKIESLTVDVNTTWADFYDDQHLSDFIIIGNCGYHNFFDISFE